MKIGVVGLWHLGSVTAACVANAEHEVLAYDPDKTVITKLQNGRAPIFEPGLDLLLEKGRKIGKLNYTSDPNDLSDSEILWVTFDTPVDHNDIADVAFVTDSIKAIIPYVQKNVFILISSQLPVGTTRSLQEFCSQQWPTKNITLGVSPENLRLGKGIDVFTKADRIVVGIQSEADKSRIQPLLNSFTQNIIWMSIESAEMTKHALNAFLATSVVFINELATLCERVGADAREVELGLKSEERIGKKAYLRPGDAIAGGTLARDVNYLIEIGRGAAASLGLSGKVPRQGIIEYKTPLLSALLESNQLHKQWSCRRILEILPDIQNKTIAILGLTYKVDTDTLRRSSALEIGEWLHEKGAKIVAYDPAVTHLPHLFANFIALKPSVEHALSGADAVIVTNECPQFTSLSADQLITNMNAPLVFDASGFLSKGLGRDTRIHYHSVGYSAACN